MNTTLLVSKRSELVRLNPAFNLLRCYLCAEPIPQPPSPPQEDESNITQAVQLLLEIPHQEWSSSKPLQSLFFSPPPPPPPPSPCFLFKVTRSLPSYCQAFNFFNHLQKSFPFEDTHFLSYPFQVLEQAGRERNAGSWLFELIKLPNMGNSFDCLRRRASYSAVPHSRRETNDSYNDETFDSTECTSEDRAEEERKRRASFESWKKEQQKAFQEKKINPERRKDDFDISELLEDSKGDKGVANRNKESDEPIPASNIVSDKPSLHSQTPASRPLVPPGFTSTVLERNVGTKSSMHSHSSQYEEETLSEQRLESKNIHLLDDIRSVKAPNTTSALDKFNDTISKDSQIYKSSSLSEAFIALGNGEVTELDSKKLVADKIVTETNQDGSISILDKLFGTAVTANGGGSTNITAVLFCL